MSMSDDKEYFVDEYELVDNIFNEDANLESVCKASMVVAFQHLIKYEIIRYKQDTAWIQSIKRVIDNVGDISNLSKIQIRHIDNDIDNIYSKARSKAKTELKKKGYTEANFESPINRPKHYTLDFLFDEDGIDKYLRSISLTREVRDYYDLKPTLNKLEEAIMASRMPLDKAFPGLK